jgi:hypothetical protein
MGMRMREIDMGRSLWAHRSPVTSEGACCARACCFYPYPAITGLEKAVTCFQSPISPHALNSPESADNKSYYGIDTATLSTLP